jgi:hypothetical protein
VDFNGDGILDLVSGSYDPGELYWFRGLGKGQFAAREVIRDRSGKPVLKDPDQKDKVESFGSWMTLADWSDSGKLDLLVGTYDGLMFLRRNEGTRTRPVYSPVNEWVMVGNKRLRVPGGGHANPVIADWDGDGLWDIITGSSDGGVYWYRNIGRKGQPRFAPPVALVPAHKGIGYAELLRPGQEPRPGIRSQIAVVDYDGDGKLDLLVGDFCTYLQIRPDLTPAQQAKLTATYAAHDRTVTELRACMDRLREQFKAAMKGVPESDWNTKENQEKWQAMYQKLRQSPSYTRLDEDYTRLEKELRDFAQTDAARPGAPDVPHGYVWLFRRK